MGVLIWRGFRATAEPSGFERNVARTVRNLAIPRSASNQKNPLQPTPENLRQAREVFLAQCSTCHGYVETGVPQIGRALYPRAPDLRSRLTQSLTDGEIHYIIENGVQLTGMPAWKNADATRGDDPWRLALFIRSLRPLSTQEQAQEASSAASAHYIGSLACRKCHEQIYDRWQKTPMANVVRDPHEHPDAIIPDLATNPFAKFTKKDVAFVYGSVWKQRYFTKIGDDYYPEPAQWDVATRQWLKYNVPQGADWWVAYYPRPRPSARLQLRRPDYPAQKTARESRGGTLDSRWGCCSVLPLDYGFAGARRASKLTSSFDPSFANLASSFSAAGRGSSRPRICPSVQISDKK